MIYLYLVTSILFLLANYAIAGYDLFNPTVVFCAINMASGLLCATVSRLYQINIHLNTYLVLLSGLVIFTVSNYFESFVQQKQENSGMQMVRRIFQPYTYIDVRGYWIVLLILFEMVVGYFLLDYIRRVVSAFYGRSFDFSASLGRYNTIVKSHGDELADLKVRAGIFVKHGQWMMVGASIVFSGIGFNNYFARRKWEIKLFVPFVIMVFISFFTGSRSAAFRYLTLLLMEYIIIRKRATGRTFRGSMKMIIKIIAVAIALPALFWATLTVIGRSKNYYWYEYILAYIGGPVYNLDIFLSEPLKLTARFGQETFRNFYYWAGNRFGIPELIYTLNIPYITYNGYYMGNVYTMYYMFIEDFGYWGVVPLTTITALYYNSSYRRYMNSTRQKYAMSWGMFVFCFLYNDVFMLLFSNRFYENVFRDRNLKVFFYMAVVWLCAKHGLFSIGLGKAQNTE